MVWIQNGPTFPIRHAYIQINWSEKFHGVTRAPVQVNIDSTKHIIISYTAKEDRTASQIRAMRIYKLYNALTQGRPIQIHKESLDFGLWHKIFMLLVDISQLGLSDRWSMMDSRSVCMHKWCRKMDLDIFYARHGNTVRSDKRIGKIERSVPRLHCILVRTMTIVETLAQTPDYQLQCML